MFRRLVAFIAVISVAVALMATVVMLAQPGAPTGSTTDVSVAPTAPSSTASLIEPSKPVDDAATTESAESTSTPPPVRADTTTPPTSTPEMTSQEDAAPYLAVTPYTPQVPEGTEVPQRNVDAPLQLKIPAIGVDAEIEWVGVDEMGNMGVPSTYRSVAWFERGPRPGMTGNAVVAGHLDSQTGPAVFYGLGDLQPGDEIVVTAHDGEELRFVVDGMERFNSDTAPVYDIFGPSSGQHLNLITCEGTFDPAARQYDERLVVYSTLVTS